MRFNSAFKGLKYIRNLVLSKSDEVILGDFERKILRDIFKATNDNGE